MTGYPLAFRCKNCGHLEGCDHAGEAAHPFQCRVCGKGVTHSPTVAAFAAELAIPECTPERRIEIAKALTKVGNERPKIHPENWEILADATDERLKELGLARDDVVKHTPYPNGEQTGGVNLVATAHDGPVTTDTLK